MEIWKKMWVGVFFWTQCKSRFTYLLQPAGGRISTICLAVLAQYRRNRQTDGRTNGWTDVVRPQILRRKWLDGGRVRICVRTWMNCLFMAPPPPCVDFSDDRQSVATGTDNHCWSGLQQIDHYSRSTPGPSTDFTDMRRHHYLLRLLNESDRRNLHNTCMVTNNKSKYYKD